MGMTERSERRGRGEGHRGSTAASDQTVLPTPHGPHSSPRLVLVCTGGPCGAPRVWHPGIHPLMHGGRWKLGMGRACKALGCMRGAPWCV